MVRAKFRLNSITVELHTGSHQEEKDGKQVWVTDPPKEKRTLNMTPVYSQDPDSENKSFWDATPSGSLQLGVVNQTAWQHFDLGKEYYVDFSPAE